MVEPADAGKKDDETHGGKPDADASLRAKEQRVRAAARYVELNLRDVSLQTNEEEAEEGRLYEALSGTPELTRASEEIAAAWERKSGNNQRSKARPELRATLAARGKAKARARPAASSSTAEGRAAGSLDRLHEALGRQRWGE